MDFQDLCPNCSCDLNNEKNVLLTEESAIFKGHNVYMLCKNCGYVMIYNKDRNLIFNIDKYKDDKEVLVEIENLISKADSHYTLNLDESDGEEIIEEKYYPEQCNGACSSCQGCTQKVKEDEVEVEEILKTQEKEEQPKQEFSPEMVKDTFLIINKEGVAQIVKLDDLQYVSDLYNYSVFALEEVELEPVVTFRVHKK